LFLLRAIGVLSVGIRADERDPARLEELNIFHGATCTGSKQGLASGALNLQTLDYIKGRTVNIEILRLERSAVLIQIPVATHAHEIVSCQSRALPKSVSRRDDP
jgi:hypothetical protein